MTWNDLHICSISDTQNDKLHVGAQFIAPSCHTTQAHISDRLNVGAALSAQFIAPSRHTAYELGAMNCDPTPIVLSNQHHKGERNHHAL